MDSPYRCQPLSQPPRRVRWRLGQRLVLLVRGRFKDRTVRCPFCHKLLKVHWIRGLSGFGYNIDTHIRQDLCEGCS